MQNPFTLKVVVDPDRFCNRVAEMQKLRAFAESCTNAVVFSPRRYGKTSLVRQVQQQLEVAGYVAIYIDLFGLSSADTIASRITKGIYKALYAQKPLWEKALAVIKTHRPVIRPDEGGFTITAEVAGSRLFGSELLDQTLQELGQFLAGEKQKTNIVLDEFQEITKINDPDVEGVLRAHIQHHKASYFFVGSRRRVLLEMFTQRRRPFFQSAINVELDKLPHDELVLFIARQFAAGKKYCSPKIAEAIAAAVADHPYYCQKLAFFCYERTERQVASGSVHQAFEDLIQAETPVFEATLQGLSPRQIALLKAIAREPAESLMAMAYIKRHALKSIGGIQAALKRLDQLDLVERLPDKQWIVVDPMFQHWLSR